MSATREDIVTLADQLIRTKGRLDIRLLVSGLSCSLLLSRVLGNAVFDCMMDQFLKDLGTGPANWVKKDPD